MEALHDREDAEIRLLRGEVKSFLEDLQIPDAIDGSVTIPTSDVIARIFRKRESVEEQLQMGSDKADLQERDESRGSRKGTPRGGAQEFARHSGEHSMISRKPRKSRNNRSNRYDPDWNSQPPSPDNWDEYESDPSDDNEVSSEDADQRRRKRRQGEMHGRQHGNKLHGLKVPRPHNRLFDGAIDYRPVQADKTSQTSKWLGNP